MDSNPILVAVCRVQKTVSGYSTRNASFYLCFSRTVETWKIPWFLPSSSQRCQKLVSLPLLIFFFFFETPI
jgi:hypothetical protein